MITIATGKKKIGQKAKNKVQTKRRFWRRTNSKTQNLLSHINSLPQEKNLVKKVEKPGVLVLIINSYPRKMANFYFMAWNWGSW